MLPRNAHDSLVQLTFGSSAAIEAFLLSTLPRRIASAIRPGSLKLVHARKSGSDLRSSVPDFLCTVVIDRTTMLLSILIEHQSRPDPTMPLRMLASVVRLWQQHLRQSPSSSRTRKLPPVLPIVLFHGQHPWRGGTSTLGMIDLPASLAAGYRRYQPRSELLLVDFSRVPDETLRRAATTAFGKLALLVLKHGREKGLIEQVRDTLGRMLRELSGTPGGWDAIALLLRYILLVNPRVKTQELAEAVSPWLGSRGKEAAMTEGERLIALGEQRGRKLGEKRGKELALRETAARMGARGMPLEDIADLLGLGIEEARALVEGASVAKPESKRRAATRQRRG